ncbi:peptidoglycan-recognition protein 1-like [Macrosteles quadrilineatus]|uniref:peptidoglycan-recognition protein 1-like n=1 Tax=Macrosteles quadrilineatus TaxID=74068 RepID=UPI0023E18F88|nr:peptidoglycan-recognition protein 1-like [Macrosteles quadrilineatus]
MGVKTKIRKPWGFKKKPKRTPIITRDQWGATEPLWRDTLQVPVFNVLIKYYTDSPPCDNEEECSDNLRILQRKCQDELRLPDIPYNFVIGGDERVYEGRGWFTAPSKMFGEVAHWEDTSLDIAYLGHRMPGKHMTPALGELLEYGIDKKVIVGLFKFEVLSGWDEPPPQIKFLETQF